MVGSYLYSTWMFLRQYYAVELAVAGTVAFLLQFLVGFWFKKAIGDRRTKDPSIGVQQDINPDRGLARESVVEFQGESHGLFADKRAGQSVGAHAEAGREPSRILSHAQYYLTSVRFMSALDRKTFNKLYERCQWQTYARGATVFREGSRGKRGIYVLVRGAVEQYRDVNGEKTLVRRCAKRGECLGEIMVMVDEPWQHTCIASARETVLVFLSRELCQRFFRGHPRLLVSFVETTLGRQWRIARYVLYEAIRAKSTHPTYQSQFNRFFPGSPSDTDAASSPAESGSEQTTPADSGRTTPDYRSSPDRSSDRSGPETTEDAKVADVHVDTEDSTSRNADWLREQDTLRKFLAERREDRTTHVFLQAGEVLKERGGQYMHRMYVLLEGRVTASREGYRQEATFHRGSLIGAVSHLTSVTATHTITAATNCRLAPIALSQLPARVAMVIASTVSACLSRELYDFDALGAHIRFHKAGRLLYRRGDSAEEFFIILSGGIGIMRTVHGETAETKSGTASAHHKDDRDAGRVRFYARRGEWVGEAAFLKDTEEFTRHSHSAMCLRDSEFLAVSRGAFDLMRIKYPSILTYMGSMLASRLSASLGARGGAPAAKRISTVTILPITTQAAKRTVSVCGQLEDALCALRVGSILRLDAEGLDERLGPRSAGDLKSFVKRSRVSAWLAEMEEQHRFIILSADASDTSWTRLCVRSADHILLVGDSRDEPAISDVERKLFIGDNSSKTLASTELVLLHPFETKIPRGTALWLRPRRKLSVALTGVHHVRAARNGSEIHSERRFWGRIARVLARRGVGLVLGGGGARGLAHQGVIRACENMNIPIDFIGGTSQGSLMSALYAMHLSSEAMRESVAALAKRMGSIWGLLTDATLPILSYFSGKAFNEHIKAVIPEDVQIEDLWVPFFCITTNVSKHRYMIHKQGSLWKAVRASMSLMGYLPPMLIDGDLLVDGGYLNNLPGDVMRDHMNPAYIIGVDVETKSSEDLYNVTEFGDHLSGFWLLYRRVMGALNPFAARLRMPKFAELVSEVEFINNARNIQQLRDSGDLDLYIRPRLANTALLDYHKLDQIEKIGFDETVKQLNECIHRIPKAYLLPTWDESAAREAKGVSTTPKASVPHAAIASRDEQIASKSEPEDESYPKKRKKMQGSPGRRRKSAIASTRRSGRSKSIGASVGLGLERINTEPPKTTHRVGFVDDRVHRLSKQGGSKSYGELPLPRRVE